jgi:hypothetical protein
MLGSLVGWDLFISARHRGRRRRGRLGRGHARKQHQRSGKHLHRSNHTPMMPVEKR